MVHKIAGALVIIGALNWLLIGLFQYNLVMSIFGTWPMVERLIYILVGLSGVAMLFACKCCMGGMCKMDDKK